MDPTLWIALARLGMKLGTDLVTALKNEGWEPTDEELAAVRAASEKAKAGWDDLAPEGDPE